MATARTGTGNARSTAQTLALVLGVVYLLVGIVGFFVSAQMTGNTEKHLLGLFEVNGLHNIVHLLVGIGGIALSRTVEGARTYGLALAVVYGLTFLYGLISGDDEALLSLNMGDNLLHLLSAIAGGAIYAMSKGRTTART